MIITKTINADLWIRERTQEIYAVQGDSCTRKVAVNLFAGREPWTPEGNVSAVIRFAKPDGTGGSYDTLPNGEKAWALEKNTASFILAPQMLTVPGRVVVQIELLGGSGVIASFPLHILVEENVAAGVTRSENYFSWEQRLAWERNQTLQEAKQSGLFDGPAGPTPNLQIGTVTTAEPGSEAEATIRGTAEDPIMDLKIPRGADAPIDTALDKPGYAADAAVVGAALAGKAPAGYVETTYKVSTEADVDSALSAELAGMQENTLRLILLSPTTSNLFNGGGTLCELFYRSSSGYATARFITYGTAAPLILYKTLWAGVWRPLEYENPLMNAGEEYRTTEQVNGKSVYVKRIAFGTLPNAASKTKEHGISGKTRNIRYRIDTNSSDRLLGHCAEITNVRADASVIEITTNANLSGLDCYFTLWYTKD